MHLKELYLTGNPCCDFEGYADYVVAKLPQLQRLDIKEILKSDRIKAQQRLPELEEGIKKSQHEYELFRDEQKRRLAAESNPNLTDEEFWKTTSENCPESRIEMAERQRKAKETEKDDDKPKKKLVQFYNKEGRPLNINHAKLEFTLSDEDPKQFVLDVFVYKYLDTSLIDVDVQPIFVRITIKGKVFQIVLPEEILTEKSAAQRSQTTGHLVLKLPRANYRPISRGVDAKGDELEVEKSGRKREYLEVEEKRDMDFSKIVENNNVVRDLYDNNDIPLLEYA
ncbi:hypothetical protein NQ317_002127 [Molorchus minor]|uniref:Dynein axonemal assembly factor 11-like CS domain-containing protein n=1 Tax=Molorchus minor TaxID=1323400 RepID=A0ABQ9JWJ2_9CUCU|nr:hypothetical protein NQ317_002127 [Molorchus minor]